MLRRIESLREQVEEFAEQRDYPLLVLGCVDEDLGVVLKAIEGAEPHAPDALFVPFPYPFRSALLYVTHCAEGVRAQIQLLNGERGAEPPLPEPPPEAMDVMRPPAERFGLLLRFLRAEYLGPEGGPLVAVVLPTSIEDRAGYAEIVSALVPWTGTAGMEDLHVIVRDDRLAPWIKPGLDERGVDRAIYLEVDFGTEAMTGSLGDDAADPDLPEEQRMGALLQLALVDQAYRRPAEAASKLRVVYEWHALRDQPLPQAICLQSMGDLRAAAQQPDDALACYRHGLTLAMKAQAPVVVLNLAMAAGRTCLALGETGEAEGYFTASVDTARAAMNPFAVVEALQALGEAQVAQQKWAEAAQSWERAAAVAETIGARERQVSSLQQLRGLFTRAGLPDRAREIDVRVARAQREGPAA